MFETKFKSESGHVGGQPTLTRELAMLMWGQFLPRAASDGRFIFGRWETPETSRVRVRSAMGVPCHSISTTTNSIVLSPVLLKPQKLD